MKFSKQSTGKWHDTTECLPKTDSEIECLVMQPKYNIPTIMYFGRAEQSWMNYDGLRLGAYEIHKWISLNELVEILDGEN